MVQGYESSIITASTVGEQMVTKMLQNFHLGSSFSESRFFHRLRDKLKEGAEIKVWHIKF